MQARLAKYEFVKMYTVKCKLLPHSAKHHEYKSVLGIVEGFAFLGIARSLN